MNNQQIVLVDKKLVHKNKKENVLLQYLRRSLPITINAAIVQNIILPRLLQKDRNFFLQYYFPVFKGSEIIFYCLLGIQGSIKKNLISPFIQQGQYTEEDMTALLELYDFDEETQKYYIKPNLTVLDEMNIMNYIRNRDIPVADQNYREKIANILEDVPDFERKDIFTSKMHVNVEHPFFFEHPCDHIPGIMIIEAARQMVIASSHIYGKLPDDGMNLIVSNIKIKFERYLDLNFPVNMIGIAHKLKRDQNKTWVQLHFSVTFYQRYTKAAKISFSGRAIENKLFKFIRMDNFNYGLIPRFKLHEKYIDYMVIRDTERNEFICRIVDISHKGFQIYTENELVNTQKSAPYDFYAFFQNVGVVQGKCVLRWTKYYRNEAPYYAGFKIIDLSKNDEHNLDNAIKKHCYIHDNRKSPKTRNKAENEAES